MGGWNQSEMRWEGMEPEVGEGGNDAEEFKKPVDDGRISTCSVGGTIPLAPLGLYSDLKGQISNRDVGTLGLLFLCK